MGPILLFDGECNFCDRSVQFIIKRDPTGIYKFASLQSDIGIKLLKKHHIPQNVDSFILIEANRCYDKSSAALRVCRNLTGLWKGLYIFIIVPKSLRDFFYNIIATNRYKWFGKKDSCMIPSPDIKSRFLDDPNEV
ncbi:thiol-disulfide oxidoreductase DCC family protein [Virgibacillus sp. DJP39]|uniref:thiol-disulfide oxidoreductase DCC family protein n=1 Tax=Virgibacillus sp. DJP39 TaxID=3409790 RepID=UPI003BB4D77C